MAAKLGVAETQVEVQEVLVEHPAQLVALANL